MDLKCKEKLYMYLHKDQRVSTFLNHGHLLLMFIDIVRGLLAELEQPPADLAGGGGGEALPEDGLHDPGDGREAALLLHQGAVLVLVKQGEVGHGPGGPQLTLGRVLHPQQGDDRGQAAVVDVPLGVDVPPVPKNEILKAHS